jgi:Cu(I)/Ag(I) efflux system membrane protein CusA/SilA
MIRRIIRFLRRAPGVVLAATLVALGGAWWSMRHIPLERLPDLSDTQVIVYARWDRSPDILEDQVTYPITTALLGAPRGQGGAGLLRLRLQLRQRHLRGRHRPLLGAQPVLEYLSKITAQIPAEVKVELGTGRDSVGWVFQYPLVDRAGRHASDELPLLPGLVPPYADAERPGVAEVATVGGQVRQYQVTVNPNALIAHAAARRRHPGGAARQRRRRRPAGRARRPRVHGARPRLREIDRRHRELALTAQGGTPVRIKDVASVTLGPEMRRGIADLDGEGDVVGGIVVMRQGENALAVIERVKAKLAELRRRCPRASRW